MGAKKKPAKILESIGLRVKSIRERSGLSQKDFAEKIDVSKDVLANWEAGNNAFGAETLEVMAVKLSVSMADLLVDGDKCPKNPGVPKNPLEHNKIIWKSMAERFFYRFDGKTNAELSEKFNVSPGRLAQWKRGESRIPDAIIEDVCRSQGISRSWILCGEYPWLYSVIPEVGNTIHRLQLEKYPGKDGLRMLLVKIGISNKHWNDLISGHIFAGATSKIEMVKLAEAFEIKPIELFGDIDANLIPPNMYPTNDEEDILRKQMYRAPVDIEPLVFEYLYKLNSIQCLCGIISSMIFGENSLELLANLASENSQLSSFHMALENVIAKTNHSARESENSFETSTASSPEPEETGAGNGNPNALPPVEGGRRADHDNPSHAKAIYRLKKAISEIQISLAEAGLHVASGQSLKDYADLNPLLNNLQVLELPLQALVGILKAYQQPDVAGSNPLDGGDLGGAAS